MELILVSGNCYSLVSTIILVLFQYFIYIGGSQFGNFETISKARRNELEELLLQITPCHIWIGMLITYT